MIFTDREIKDLSKKKILVMLPRKSNFQKWKKKGKNKMKELTLNIYNEKGEREFDYTERDYKEIQKRFADLMFLKNVLKINYRMKTTSNYDSTYKVTFKDMGNNWTFEFDGVNSEKLSMI